MSDVFSASSGFKSNTSSRGGSGPSSRKCSGAGLRVGMGPRRASGSILTAVYGLDVPSAKSR